MAVRMWSPDQDRARWLAGFREDLGDGAYIETGAHGFDPASLVSYVRVCTGPLTVEILPPRGMGLQGVWTHEVGAPVEQWKALGWRSPVKRPKHPSRVPLWDPSGLGWLDGFTEFLVRCGIESNGAMEFDQQGRLVYPLHGKIANQVADEVFVTFDDSRGIIEVHGVVREARFHFRKYRLVTLLSAQIGTTRLSLRDELYGDSAVKQPAQMLYHVNWDSPYLQRLRMPFERLMPRGDGESSKHVGGWHTMPPPQAGVKERAYYVQLRGRASDGATAVLVHSTDETVGARLGFKVKQLPCFTVWQNPVAEEDGYTLGTEPGTNYPNPRTFEGQHGREVELLPGQPYVMELDLEALQGVEAVRAVAAEIEALQGTSPGVVEPAPDGNWSALEKEPAEK
jgi:hypothetical protein